MGERIPHQQLIMDFCKENPGFYVMYTNSTVAGLSLYIKNGDRDDILYERIGVNQVASLLRESKQTVEFNKWNEETEE